MSCTFPAAHTGRVGLLQRWKSLDLLSQSSRCLRESRSGPSHVRREASDVIGYNNGSKQYHRTCHSAKEASLRRAASSQASPSRSAQPATHLGCSNEAGGDDGHLPRVAKIQRGDLAQQARARSIAAPDRLCLNPLVQVLQSRHIFPLRPARQQ